MGSSLEPVLAEILMVCLERSLVNLLTAELNFWKQFVDDTITSIKIGTVGKFTIMISTSHMRQNII